MSKIMLFRGTLSLESVHKRRVLASLGKNMGVVDGQLEKEKKGKKRKMTSKQSSLFRRWLHRRHDGPYLEAKRRDQ